MNFLPDSQPQPHTHTHTHTVYLVLNLFEKLPTLFGGWLGGVVKTASVHTSSRVNFLLDSQPLGQMWSTFEQSFSMWCCIDNDNNIHRVSHGGVIYSIWELHYQRIYQKCAHTNHTLYPYFNVDQTLPQDKGIFLTCSCWEGMSFLQCGHGSGLMGHSIASCLLSMRYWMY